MFTVNQAEARQGRARDKARAVRPAVIAHSANGLRVEGSGGDFYAVEGDAVGCTCMAG